MVAPARDRVAVVTGAAGGIGTAIARRFASDGARLVLVDLNPGGVETLAATFGPDAVAVAVDLTAEQAPDEVVAAALAAYGRIDVLVNNAGIARFGPAESFAAADWDDVLGVNLRAPFRLCQAVGRSLRESGRPGTIVNIASIAGRTAAPLNVPYGVSKAGIVSLTRHLAVEWGPAGIRVNAVSPGPVTWSMPPLPPDPEVKRRQAEAAPLRLLPEPEDIAAAVSFLASESARCITGVVLDVDGGYLLTALASLPRRSGP